MEQLSPKQNVAVDLIPIAFDTENHKLMVYAPVRTLPYATGQRALPGTLLNEAEGVGSAVERIINTKLDREVGVHLLHALAPKTNPDRDPRGHVISLPMVLFLPGGWLNEDWLPLERDMDLAFDHAEIVNDALDYIQQSLLTKPKVLGALPKECFVKDARDAYAHIDVSHNKTTTNFTQQTPVLDFMKDSGRKQHTGKRGGQPTIYSIDYDALS